MESLVCLTLPWHRGLFFGELWYRHYQAGVVRTRIDFPGRDLQAPLRQLVRQVHQLDEFIQVNSRIQKTDRANPKSRPSNSAEVPSPSVVDSR